MLKQIFASNSGKKVVGNFAALLTIQGANFILPLITLPYLVRVLGEEKFGLVMIAQALGVFLNVIVDFGFQISGTRAVSLLEGDKKRLSQLYANILGIKLILTLLLFLMLLILVKQISRFEAESSVYLLSFLMVVGQALFPTWFFQGIERMKVITVVNVMAKVLFTIAIFLIVLTPEDYFWVPLCHGGGFVIAGFFGLLYSLKYVSLVRPRAPQMKTLVLESAPLFVSNCATTLYTSSNTFILGMIGGDAIAGVYSSMEKLVLAIKNVFVPLYQAIFPWLAKKEPTEIKQFIRKMFLPIGAVGLGIVLFFLITSRWLLDVIYVNEIITSYAGVLQILGIIGLCAALNMLLVSLFFPAIKAYKTRMIIQVTGGIFNLIVVLIAATYVGIYGVACTAVASELLLLLIAFYFYNKSQSSTSNG